MDGSEGVDSIASSPPNAVEFDMLTARNLQRLQVGPIDLTVEPGICVAIMGPSGAGKSVLLRMLADLDPHLGTVMLDGIDCASIAAPLWRRRVTYVAANAGWWMPDVAGHFREDSDMSTLLPSVGLPAEARAWPIARLSTGERQRLALLRALGPDTRVLLLDEPTSGLDSHSVLRVEALLAERMRAGLSIVWVTHDPTQAARVGTRRMNLRDGRLLEAHGG